MFTRKKTDEDYHKLQLQDSVGITSWTMSRPNSACVSPNMVTSDPRRRNQVGVPKNFSKVVDLESGLLKGNTVVFDEVNEVNEVEKKEIIEQLDTRMTNPPSTLRGTGFNRWNWVCDGAPLSFPEFDSSISSRILAKDYHKPIISIPVDQSSALPRFLI